MIIECLPPSPKRAFKNQTYEQFAHVAKALANAHRLELIDLLAQREFSVEELSSEAELSVANTSQHLQVLRAARLVEQRRDGRHIHYRLADQGVFHVWQAMRELGETRLAEIERIKNDYLRDRDKLEAVAARALLERLRSDDVILLDVRPEKEYRAGHITGAPSVPVARLATQLHHLPHDKEVIAYCRGPYCVLAIDAVQQLRASGFQARRLEEVMPDWKLAGLPVAHDGEAAT